MYHSIFFKTKVGNKNTFEDWHLVPDSRPVIPLPDQKKQMVDVPGANSSLDLSMALYKYPIYNRRSGSFTFHVLNGYREWNDLYEELAALLHGQKCEMWLEDDPDFCYIGYFTVVWTSNNNGTWSDVEIGYDLEPYKYSREIIYINNTSTLTYSQTEQSIAYRPSEIVLPTPLIVNVSEITNNTIAMFDYKNPDLDIDDSTHQYTITKAGMYTINRWPVSSDRPNAYDHIIHILLSYSTNTSGYIVYRIGYRSAKL